MLRVAFDIGGVLSKYPSIIGAMMQALTKGGAEVCIITDMHDPQQARRMLDENGVNAATPLHCANYAAHGEMCKAVLCEQLKIDVLVDDFIGYVAEKGAPVRLLVMPDVNLPYWADEWKTQPEDGEFGRRGKEFGRRGKECRATKLESEK